jgi:hypothetical protein
MKVTFGLVGKFVLIVNAAESRKELIDFSPCAQGRHEFS